MRNEENGSARSQPARYADLPPKLQAAINAYDAARRALANTYTITGPGEPAMSDANKMTIAPMIEAAVMAYCASPKATAVIPCQLGGGGS